MAQVKSIARCVPTLGTVSIFWVRCVEGILWPNAAGKTLFYLRDGEGGEIAETRNALVQQVIEYDRDVSPISHIHWIDDDVFVQRGCLRQLLAYDYDIASGVYFTKVEGLAAEPLIYPTPTSGADKFIPDQAYEVWGHGMGNTLIKLDVYHRMREDLKLPLDKYGRPTWYKTTHGRDDALVEDEKGVVHEGMTEDLFFCDNAEKLGIKKLVDTSKHAFGFHFDQVYTCECGFETHSRERAVQHRLMTQARPYAHKMKMEDRGYPDRQWRQWVGGEKITWGTPEGVVEWE